MGCRQRVIEDDLTPNSTLYPPKDTNSASALPSMVWYTSLTCPAAMEQPPLDKKWTNWSRALQAWHPR